jgi:hypothetical protein
MFLLRPVVKTVLVLVLVSGAVHRSAPAQANDDPPVRVELVSGRVLVGQVDARSGSNRLWLRTGDAQAHVVRPVDWDRVARATVAGNALEPAAFRAWVLERPPVEPPPAAVAGSRVDGGVRASADPRPLPAASKVRTLVLSAYLANWDADVEADGLIVSAAPLDESGRITEVRGTLEAELIGTQRLSRTRGEPLPQMARWTVPLQGSLGPEGYTLRMPFQAVDPEYATALWSHGLVRGRLVAPGHGVFEADAGLVRIRAFNPLRDRQQLQRGTRFFPGELTGQGAYRVGLTP